MPHVPSWRILCFRNELFKGLRYLAATLEKRRSAGENKEGEWKTAKRWIMHEDQKYFDTYAGDWERGRIKDGFLLYTRPVKQTGIKRRSGTIEKLQGSGVLSTIGSFAIPFSQLLRWRLFATLTSRNAASSRVRILHRVSSDGDNVFTISRFARWEMGLFALMRVYFCFPFLLRPLLSLRDGNEVSTRGNLFHDTY